MIRELILDWSGTLADDAALTLEVTNDVLEHFGAARIDADTYAREFVIPVEGFYEPRIGPRGRAAIDAVFFERLRARAGETRLFDAVPALLHLCRHHGIAVRLLSTLPADILAAQCARLGIDGLISAIHGGAGDKVPVLRELMSELDLAGDQVLYVGDTPHDIEAAHAAGVRAGAALYGYSGARRLDAAGPDHRFAAVGNIIDFIEHQQVSARERRVIATVGGFVQCASGELLLIRTRKWSDKWGIPGGKVAYGETLLAAYYREMREETGIDLDNARYLETLEAIESPEFTAPRHFLLINYVSRVAGRPAPHPNYEAESMDWYAPDAALRMNLNQPTRTALELALARGLVEPA